MNRLDMVSSEDKKAWAQYYKDTQQQVRRTHTAALSSGSQDTSQPPMDWYDFYAATGITIDTAVYPWHQHHPHC
jgi:hypothetical protein